VEPREALDALQPILGKLDVFYQLKGILEVVAAATTTTKDAKAELASVQAQIDAAHKTLTLEQESVAKVRVDFDAECSTKVAQATGEINNERAKWALEQQTLTKQKADLENAVTLLEKQRADAEKSFATRKSALDTEISTLEARRDAVQTVIDDATASIIGHATKKATPAHAD
jgi:chromosome segregation ATPase